MPEFIYIQRVKDWLGETLMWRFISSRHYTGVRWYDVLAYVRRTDIENFLAEYGVAE